jgi:uncharacterized tellurite resistance protein B-like protein
VILRRKKGKPMRGSEPPSDLARAVQAHLPDANEDTCRIVTAVVGLLGCVAYADHDYSQVEQDKVREELSRIKGLDALHVGAICHVLRDHVLEISTLQSHIWTRELRQLAGMELRLEVLDLLMDLAAVDDDVSVEEVNSLRRIAAALGLSQDDYNRSQERHRDKIAALK